MDGTILIADDDKTIRTVLTQAFTRAGCKVHATSSLITLMRWVGNGKGDLVISDVMMPDGNGLENLRHIKKLRPSLPVIIISAQNTIVTAIRANEAKAFDYLPKPFDLPELMRRSAIALKRKKLSSVSLMPSMDLDLTIPLIGQSSAMQELYRLIARAMVSSAPILIYGEPGSGKSTVAKGLHNLSSRSAAPYIVVDPTIAEDQDELDRAIDLAKDGTLVVDGVGDLSTSAQLKLLNTLGEPESLSTRLICVANQRICADRDDGKFRQDLFFRISSLQLEVPALRDRVEDIPFLAAHFISEIGNSEPYEFNQDCLNALRAFDWPGNVRQLKNVVRQVIFEAAGSVLTIAALESILNRGVTSLDTGMGSRGKTLGDAVQFHVQRYFDFHGAELPPPGVYHRILKEIEIPLLEIALYSSAGNQAKCADMLGLNRNTLRKKINEFDIAVKRRRKLM
ncbi:MAG: response regulator, partial [Planktomarina sp.]|nr:response regulator [Planktomarina sp.]